MSIESCTRTSFYARALWVYEGFSKVSKLPSKRRPSAFLMLVPDRLLTKELTVLQERQEFPFQQKVQLCGFDLFWVFIEFHLIPMEVHCADVETSSAQAAGLELVVRAWWRGARSGCGPKEAGCGDHTWCGNDFLERIFCGSFRVLQYELFFCLDKKWQSFQQWTVRVNSLWVFALHSDQCRCLVVRWPGWEKQPLVASWVVPMIGCYAVGQGPKLPELCCRWQFHFNQPHNKIDSHCQHHSLHSLIRDWLSVQSHVTTFATFASVINR